ncbi:tetratricopeptide repeat protein [Streptomyces sp. NPDC005808]|uniref:tetratricopeptide repeat protein n=1 Tax=Streptomyces sp. NPDC005808 TaxID=3364734 RepID=UPI0036C01C50
MPTTTSVSEEELRTLLAERSGLPADSLWVPVHLAPRTFGTSWPLSGTRAEEVLSGLLDGLRRVLPPPLHDDEDGHGRRYVYLSEITGRYERCDTRRILDRIHAAGVTPARQDFDGEDYDPRSERGWGARPSAVADRGGTPSWTWWRAVREAGPRPFYQMPDPYVGEGALPVDRALDLREGTGNDAAYREALRAAVREDPRQIDCWAHLGSDAFTRAETDDSALSEALGFYQTAVAVAELSLPPAFSGVLAWSELNNRPFHRALHGLGLTWWQLGEPEKAAAVFGNSLWTNPDDNQGIRYLIKQVRAGVPWHQHTGE